MRFCYLNILNSVDTAYLLERLPGVIFTIDPGVRLVRIRSVGAHTVGGCAPFHEWSLLGSGPARPSNEYLRVNNFPPCFAQLPKFLS